jgi:hypothetical protein
MTSRRDGRSGQHRRLLLRSPVAKRAFASRQVPAAAEALISWKWCAARSASCQKRAQSAPGRTRAARRSGLPAGGWRLADRRFPVPRRDAGYRQRGQRRSPARSRPEWSAQWLPTPPNCNDEAWTSCLAASLHDCQAKVAMTPMQRVSRVNRARAESAGGNYPQKPWRSLRYEFQKGPPPRHWPHPQAIFCGSL